MTRLRTIVLFTFLFAMASATSVFADSGFTGPFAQANWTETLNGGSINTSGMPTTLGLTSRDVGGCPSGAGSALTSFSITVALPTTLSFNWDYSTQDIDGPLHDPARFSVNGIPTQLTNDAGSSTQNGVVNNLHLSPGDTFAFEEFSDDSVCGAGTVTISNFTFIQQVNLAGIPTLSEWGMIILSSMLALGAAFILRRRRR